MPAVLDAQLTTSEAARRLGLSENSVRGLVRTGKLDAQITPLGALISPASVERLRLARERANRVPHGPTRRIRPVRAAGPRHEGAGDDARRG